MKQLLSVTCEKNDDSATLEYDDIRMKLRVFLVFTLFITSLSSLSSVFAADEENIVDTAQREYARQFSSPQIEWVEKNQAAELKNGRYPWLMSFLMNKVLSWKPLEPRKKYSSGCDPDLWADRMQDPRLKNVQLQGALIQKYFQNCKAELENGQNNVLWNTLRFLTIDMNFHEHPFLNRVQFNLPNGVRLQGLLALKGDYKPRPLIVMRMGIFTNVDEALGERFFMMSWFEQGPFNVLFLDNISGALFINQNEKVSFGGFDEAIQNIQIARLLRDENQPLSRLVSAVHFAGVSLGGNGVLYSSLLNETNSYKGKRLINSFMGFCPVVYLKDSMDRLTAPGLKAKFVDFWSQRRLAGLKERLPQEAPMFQFLPKAIEHMIATYKGGLTWDGTVSLPAGMRNSSDFWSVNDFVSKYKDVQAPFLSLVTRNDDLVPSGLNSERLHAENFKMVKFDQGFHCTLPIPYHWEVWPSLMNSYFISHSPQVTFSTVEVPVPVIVNKTQRDLGFSIEFNDQKRYVTLQLVGPFDSKTVHLPLSGFDFTFHNEKLTLQEKEMLTRWLNQNLRLTIRGNDLVLSWKVFK